ncbi:hypothetical protein [Oribacterium sp. WCC10]|uniref:hypothetical protein n=1 Tax=Oribacterium sp. WCC10 TaxID=1855343 RepID=UPI0008E32C18|nr:hypothetical protein [Oribacterium sp. WCC10]SFG59042.1 hypothetical protein SAMN05216356_11421 [Oribacterium sp. WCC10]
MVVLYGIGMIIRFILKVALLPVQAALTLLLFALCYVGGLVTYASELLGTFLIFCGICTFWMKGPATMGWQGIIAGILFAIIPQALTLWGAEGVLCLKDLLGRV